MFCPYFLQKHIKYKKEMVQSFLSAQTAQVILEGDILVSLGRGSKLTAFIPVKVPSTYCPGLGELLVYVIASPP